MAVSSPEEEPLYSDGEELELAEFFDHVMMQQFSLKNREFVRNVLIRLKAIRNYKSPVPEAIDFTYVTFNDAHTRCAYMYAYSVLHCVMVVEHFLKFLKANVDIRKKLITMKKFRLCCLGGGPAPEVVAICKVLNDMLKKFVPEKRPPLDVYVTVIDKCGAWEKDASAVVKSIEKNKHLCTGGTMKINFKFIKVDLIHSFMPDVRAVLKEADFVTMVKFISAVNSKHHLNVCSMIDEVIENMKVGGCVFFIDNAGGGFFNDVDKTINKLSVCEMIYGPCLHSKHVLCIKTAQKFTELFGTVSRVIPCTVRTTVSCSVWIKTEEYDSEERKSAGDPKLKNKKRNSRKRDKVKPEQSLENSKDETRAEREDKYEKKKHEKKRIQKRLLEAIDDVRMNK